MKSKMIRKKKQISVNFSEENYKRLVTYVKFSDDSERSLASVVREIIMNKVVKNEISKKV